MAEPIVGPDTIQWPFDSVDDYVNAPAFEARRGEMRLAEITPDVSLLGGDSGEWTDNEGPMVSVSGDTINGTNAWDEDAVDNAAFKGNFDTGGVSKVSNASAGADIPNTWSVTTFWFYDDASSVNTRRGYVGIFVSKYVPLWGIMWHPGDPTYPNNYIFVQQLSGWTATTTTAVAKVNSNVVRAPGWHFVLMAGVSTALADNRVLIIDNSVIQNVTAAPGTLVLPRSGGGRVGAYYTGDYTSKPFYVDTMKSWKASKRYPGQAQLTFPPAQPERMAAFTSLSSTVLPDGIDRRGTIGQFYQVSTDGGATWGPAKTLDSGNLLAESFVGNGQDLIRPFAFFNTTTSLISRDGLFTPRWGDLTLGYRGLWSEDSAAGGLWTEDT